MCDKSQWVIRDSGWLNLGQFVDDIYFLLLHIFHTFSELTNINKKFIF